MSANKDLKSLEGALGMHFNNADLLKTALTHRSYLNENFGNDIREGIYIKFSFYQYS